LVSDLVSISLGLVAFAWLMWVTLPWAFGERLDFYALRKKIEPNDFRNPSERQITPLDVKKAEKWLTDAGDEFLGAGAVFLMSGLFELRARARGPP